MKTKNYRFLPIWSKGGFQDLTNMKQGDEMWRQNNKNDVWKSSTKIGSETRASSFKKRGDQYIRSQNKSMNKYLQQQIVAQTKFRQCTIQMKTEHHLRRKNMKKIHQLARTAKTGFHLEEKNLITENYSLCRLQRSGCSKFQQCHLVQKKD